MPARFISEFDLYSFSRSPTGMQREHENNRGLAHQEKRERRLRAELVEG